MNFIVKNTCTYKLYPSYWTQYTPRLGTNICGQHKSLFRLGIEHTTRVVLIVGMVTSQTSTQRRAVYSINFVIIYLRCIISSRGHY